MPKALIVSPHFPPVNAPDMHRVRMLLPFFAENDWQMEVLAVSPQRVAAPLDPWLARTLPPEICVHRVDSLGLAWSRIPGLGALGFRALPWLARAGDRLIATRNFDLVYFSTTQFEVHLLGPRWKRKFGVPFVIDYQDPWVNDYYREHPEIIPPGGRLKHAVASSLHRWMEPRVLRECSGLTSVSPEYPRQLARRYRWFQHMTELVQPFPGSTRDFEHLPRQESEWPPLVDFADGCRHWLYVGRGGADMAKAMSAIFLALRDHAPESLKRRLKIHLIGTSYAPPATAVPSLAPLADRFGVTDHVREFPCRIPYSQTLALLRKADALIVPGSDDAAYTASKIYPYLLASRPLLAVFHARSTVTELIRKVGGAVCVTFNEADDDSVLAGRIGEAWFRDHRFERQVPLNERAFEPYTDRGCAKELCAFFGACLRRT